MKEVPLMKRMFGFSGGWSKREWESERSSSQDTPDSASHGALAPQGDTSFSDLKAIFPTISGFLQDHDVAAKSSLRFLHKCIICQMETAVRGEISASTIYGAYYMCLPQPPNPRFYACPSIPRARPHLRIAQLAMIPPPLVQIPQRRPFVHARVPMAANDDHGVPFGTSPSLWHSAALEAATLHPIPQTTASAPSTFAIKYPRKSSALSNREGITLSLETSLFLVRRARESEILIIIPVFYESLQINGLKVDD
ncbi:hypothetical protein B0H13DRAFT_2380811 [Mycena leptocephala]|nr:hypothetical protein B0H13DRAFT_2380811 [Mycena leptocephala]